MTASDRLYVFYVKLTSGGVVFVLLLLLLLLSCIHQHNMNTSMAAVVGNNWEICKAKKLIIKILPCKQKQRRPEWMTTSTTKTTASTSDRWKWQPVQFLLI